MPGGSVNAANGDYAFAAGRKANAEGNGTFVWGDSSDNGVTATQDDEFKVQAGGGAVIFSSSDHSSGVNLRSGSGSWSAWSTRASKANVEAVDPETVLDGVESLDISTWNYRAQGAETRHMGPMAEEFAEAFGLGADDERISNVDADGVAFAAIQGLAERLDEREARVEELESENEELRDRLSALEARVESMATTDGAASDPALADD
ncbi:tail fiber domain-containing protein [Salinirubellus salinus]|uniref:Tail fiber domain-containing protein n=1 Tax=Salinirubellus salinus TaxID=1364945 RepID=A0A9E7UBA9_9EURY|nr:tail fiber domain-containing protein [Salinirubellus salinus]UWM54634.1 tail fiber domain-containing protein [Salinirubellus salinus]